MGFISKYSKGIFPGTNQGQAIWQQVFGNVSRNKEEAYKSPPVMGGSYGRTLTATDLSVKKLLQALRSNAPGQATQPRWEQSNHFVGIAYVAIHRIATMMSQSEFQVYQRDDSHPQGKVPAKSEAAKKIIRLLQKPNNEDSFGDLLYVISQQMFLTGSAFMWVVPNALGEPMELYNIPTATAIAGPIVDATYPSGYYRIQPLYPYGPFGMMPTPNSAVGATIPAEWFLRFKFWHPLLRYEGWSPMTALNLHIDEVEAMDSSRWYAMKRVFRPNVVANMTDMEGMQPLPAEEIERIRIEFENSFMGPDNVGNLIIPAPGMKLEEFGTSPRDMDYQAGWEQLTSFVLGGFGVTKPVAGMVEDSSYSTLFASLKQFYWTTLDPLAEKISKVLTRFLLSFYGEEDLFLEIRCKRIDDHEVKLAKMEKLITGKAITKNELRLELDMPLTEEPWGDEIAGFEAPPEQPGLMPGMEGMVGAMEQTQEEPDAISELESIMSGEQELKNDENSRPRFNEGNATALGPRDLGKALFGTNGRH